MENEIASLKKELKRLRENEANYRIAFHSSPNAVALIRLKDGVYMDVNTSYADISGYSREEMIGRTSLELDQWVDLSERAAIYEYLFERGTVKDKELRIRKRYGDLGYVKISITLIERERDLFLMVTAREISVQKMLEEKLNLTNEKFSKAFYLNPTMMAISTLDDGIYIDVNESYIKTFGFKREELIGKSSLSLGVWVNPRDRKKMRDELVQTGSVRDRLFEFRTKKGDMGIAAASASLLDIENERLILGCYADITERRRVEKALRKSQQLFFRVFDYLPLPINIWSMKDGTIMEINDAAEMAAGRPRSEILGKSFRRIGYIFNPDQARRYVQELRANGLVSNFEMESEAPDGHYRLSLLSGVVIEWEGEECILTIDNDITRLREYQKKLSRLDDLNLIGQMAASIAHEIRNPMTSIRGFLQLFHGDDRYRDDREAMDMIMEELDRVNEIITTFLSLAQVTHVELKPSNINDTIKKLLPLLQADAMKDGIAIRTELRDIAAIMIDEREIRQMLFNLVSNGIQAMDEGGHLTIRTFEDENGVNLEVEDEGPGIPLELQGKIGTPFFTTKEEGTGLGLAVCYSIAERHNAYITVNSGPGGTIFNTVFPAVS